MTKKLEELLQQARNLISTGSWDEATNLLNLLKKEYPLSPLVARLWCSLASRTGRVADVPVYAAKIYVHVQDDVHKARWALIMGIANFTLLNLATAQANFSCALEHLIGLIKAGKVPKKREQSKARSNVVNIFASGAAEQLLWKTCAELASLRIQAFPFAGTLLGIVRNGRLLDFDKDLDIGVWVESLDTCCDALEKMGWSRITTGITYSNYRDYVHSEIGVTLDVCGLQQSNETRIVGGFMLPNRPAAYQRVSVYPVFNLIQRETAFGNVWFPQQPEKILTAFYGDWRTPNPYWDSVISAPNLEHYTLLVQCYAYSRLVQHWLSGDLAKAWCYAQQIGLKDPDDVLILRSRQWLEKTMSQLNQEIPAWPQNRRRRRIYTRMVADLFHEGHVNFLRAARALGEHLTVCIVPDEHVRKNKGKCPVMRQAERMALVSACRYVDMVIADSPLNTTVEFMQTHDFDLYVFACASENERVEKYKRCALLPSHMVHEIDYTPGISTSDLVIRILNGAGIPDADLIPPVS